MINKYFPSVMKFRIPAEQYFHIAPPPPPQKKKQGYVAGMFSLF